MDSLKTFNHLLKETDLAKSKGLLYFNNIAAYSACETHLLTWGQLKIGADAVFVQHLPATGSCIPLIYFRRLEEPDPLKIAELHKLAWNMGQAPLLFVVLPGEVRIYTSYESPKIKKGTNHLDDTAGLIDIIKFVGIAEHWRQELSKYNREELLTGRFWECNKERFKPGARVERTLLANLAEIRQRLINNNNLSAQLVHRLLGRTIFIKYLQDRKDSNGRNVFPEGFFEEYQPGAKTFTDVLIDKSATYRLFLYLEKKFNGDLFPVLPEEEKIIIQKDLTLLAEFLGGKSQLTTGQLALWPYYSFDAIPIEFISNLYETFFHYEKTEPIQSSENFSRHKAGTYYTSHRLVEFLLDEVLPWDGNNIDISIIDPACGSGIFLVEAYRRLIARWQQKNFGKQPSAPDLKKLLMKNLYGVDSNPEAIKVAAFSLYLTMCDYLEPRYIWNQVTFPVLSETNLWARDFFDFVEASPVQNKKFDIVIGNPPWESQISDSASKYITKYSRSIGDKQIAQAFLWGASDICKDKGEIVLIAPSKGLLFNMSETNKAFRKEFFSSFEIRTIVNFSALRHTLFEKAVGPAAVVFYRSMPPVESSVILYCCPKPCYSPEDNWHYVIEPQDIVHITTEQAKMNPHIWKAAMWGTPRDWELIQKLNQLPNLNDICESRGWIHGEGYIIGKGKDEASWLTNKPLVTPKSISPFYINEETLPTLSEKYFYRAGKSIKKIFEGPHLLITQSPKQSKGFIATLLRNYTVFSNSIVGVKSPPSDEAVLGAVCVSLNNIIPLYYAMLTSRKWLIERDEVQKADIMSLPVPLKISEGKMLITYDELRELAKNENFAKILEDKVTAMYGLTHNELALIYDTIEYTLDYFLRKEQSVAVKRPTEDMLQAYGDLFCEVLNESFEQSRKKFTVNILTGDMPMIVAHATLNNTMRKSVVSIDFAPNRLIKQINYLDQVLYDKNSSSVYMRRNMRIYDGNDIYLVKRNQNRFWTKSAAFRDADETYADIMKSWRG